MTKNQQNLVALVCHAIVAHQFAAMHNPRFRGPNFTWDAFAENMGEWCEVNLFTHIENPTDKMKDHAKKTGRELAESLIRRMTE